MTSVGNMLRLYMFSVQSWPGCMESGSYDITAY